MPRLDLAAAARRARNVRRRSVTLREVRAPAMLATDLFTSVYRPIVQHWQAAAERIIAEYERSLSSMTQDAPPDSALRITEANRLMFADSPSDLQAEIEAAERAFAGLQITLTPALRDWALRVERVVRTRWNGAVLAATSVDLSTMIGPDDVRDTLESFIAWNTDLIADVSDQAKKRIADRVFSGLTQRKPAREVAKEIREAVAMSRRRSLAIASDQLSKISESLAEERQREAGLEVWAWVHSGKRHLREEHKARDGLLYSDNPNLVGKTVGGRPVRKPPERGDRPSQPPNCACHSRAVLVFEFDGESASD